MLVCVYSLAAGRNWCEEESEDGGCEEQGEDGGCEEEGEDGGCEDEGESSLGRYVFGSEISYNKAPPRLPGLGC